MSILIKKLASLFRTPKGETKPFTLKENKNYYIESIKGYVSSTIKISNFKVNYWSVKMSNISFFACSSE